MNTSKIDNDILINTFSNLDKESHNILFSTDINFIQFHFFPVFFNCTFLKYLHIPINPNL